MPSCTDAPPEPGPIAPLDEADFPTTIEPPTLTPIAQAYADQTSAWPSVLDSAFLALTIEQGLNLADFLGPDSGSSASDFTAQRFTAPAPSVVPTSAPFSPIYTGTAALTVIVTNYTTGGRVAGAVVQVYQLVGNDPPLTTDANGQAAMAIQPGFINLAIDAPNYAPLRASVAVNSDVTITIGMLPSDFDSMSFGTLAAFNLAALDSQMAIVRQQALNLFTFTGANPRP